MTAHSLLIGQKDKSKSRRKSSGSPVQKVHVLYPVTESLLQFIVQNEKKGEQQTTEKGNFLMVKLQHH